MVIKYEYIDNAGIIKPVYVATSRTLKISMTTLLARNLRRILEWLNMKRWMSQTAQNALA